MERCVILGGAKIANYASVKKELHPDDFIICCDSGLKHAVPLGIEPSLIVGDFDSHPRPETDVETIVLPCEKDDTDTVYAVKEALRRGYEEFLLLGVVGERLDHTLGNVSILLMLHAQRKRGRIVDDYSDMEIVTAFPVEIGPEYPFFSLLNISGLARGIYVDNAKYPLENAEISCRYQYGVSNEPLPGMTAHVRVEEGEALLIRIR